MAMEHVVENAGPGSHCHAIRQADRPRDALPASHAAGQRQRDGQAGDHPHHIQHGVRADGTEMHVHASFLGPRGSIGAF